MNLIYLLVFPDLPFLKMLLNFYEGIVFWLRLRDDMLDYAKNLTVARAGNIHIQEFPPNPPVTEGLSFNGIDQFLRIGDTKDLTFGDVVHLRYLRATSFWVYFEEFTNNAHIYDFGNGPNKDNVFVGIIGRGNEGPQTDILQKPVCDDQATNTIPAAPSGQQCTEEVTLCFQSQCAHCLTAETKNVCLRDHKVI